jgi:hypothetical protein
VEEAVDAVEEDGRSVYLHFDLFGGSFDRATFEALACTTTTTKINNDGFQRKLKVGNENTAEKR